MDAVLTKIKSVADSEEDNDEDCENFFLQPSASPYNIAEKVQKANLALFEEEIVENRPSKVKFKENLVDYEPSSTDDDVNSIESDANVDYLEHQEEKSDVNVQILQYKLQENVRLDDSISDDSIVEEVIQECVVLQKNDGNKDNGLPVETIKNSDNTLNLINEKEKKKKSTIKFMNNLPHIDCKNHCIERFDCNFNLCINKVNLQEKPQMLPKLKLQRRKCCERNKAKEQHLPTYTGLYSEYGLSSIQLERREKRKEILKMKEERRQKLLKEYKERKIQQNEEVFNRWLKEIERRKQNVQNIKMRSKQEMKTCLTPKVVSVPNNFQNKERPKTANNFIPSYDIKRTKRPHSTPACVFIQIPPHILRRGLNIGDLLINSNKNEHLRKLHVLTFS